MTISTRIFIGFFIVIGLSLINSYANYILSQKVNTNSEFLATSETIIRNSSKLHESIISMQSAHRGYLLTDDSTFLEPYNTGLVSIPLLINEQHKIIKESDAQKSKLDSILTLHKKWTDYATTLIVAKQNYNNSLPNNYSQLFDTQFKAQFGKKINDSIGTKFQEFDRQEYKIRGWRREILNASIVQTQFYSIVFIVLTIIIGLLSTFYIIRIISKRIKSMVHLAENISNGRFLSVKDEQNDELTSLSTSLNSMSGTLSKNITELEKRNRELDQFAYVVSHDLKAPIRGIYNAVQWIEEDLGNELSAQMRKYLSIIPERIKRMDDLIDALLHYARISRSQAETESVDVYALIKEVVDSIVPADFEVDIQQMPTLKTEKIRIEQVFSNLVSNAVKYKSERPGKISIGYRELSKFHEFKVSDNGIGIDSKYFDKIFIIFQTLREKNAKESTGIGLAIVRKIIEDKQGSIKVESEIGKGTSFVFTWPKS